MLKLTRKLDYSILLMVHLAKHPTAPVSAKEVARFYDLSPSLIANLMKVLAKGKLIESTRGKNGGYKLSKPMSEITLGQVIRQVEGPFNFTECSANNFAADDCSLWDKCPSKGPLQIIHQKIFGFLENTTVGEIAFPEQDTPSLDTHGETLVQTLIK